MNQEYMSIGTTWEGSARVRI